MIYSFIFIRSVMCEIDKNVHLIEMRQVGHTLSFQKRVCQGFLPKILRVASLLGEMFIFSIPMGQPKFQEFSNFLFLLILNFLQTFQNNLNYACNSNIREIMKLYNQGDQRFETEFQRETKLNIQTEN